MKIVRLLSLIALLFVGFAPTANAQIEAKAGNKTISISVTDKNTKEAVMMATATLNPLGLITVTDIDGKARFEKVPNGNFVLRVTYVGYEEYTTNLKIETDLNVNVALVPTSLALREVTVTARQNASGASTSSIIGRQAIDHLQASSLSDIMQLIPGQMIRNTDLTSQSNLQLRTLVNNNTSAFGSSVVVDGVPMSNNGAMTQGQFSSTAFVGTDLRQIAADNIESVEVIRGIPSAEYGDLTSGLVVVNSKMGVTPWQLRGKVNPEMTNISLGKGFSLNRAGILNFNFDYAKAWGDPRQKTRSYGRSTFNLGYSYDISKKWHTQTKLRMLYAKDWSGKDPDAIQDGTYSKNRNINFGLTHNGRISVDKLFMRTLNYTFGLTYGETDNINSGFVTNSTGLLPIITAMETGYNIVPWLTQSYLATGRTESRPGSVYAKLNNSFYCKLGDTHQAFKLGMDYHYDWNSGKGYYNDDDTRPYRPNSSGRPRAFSDVPGIHQLSAYVEDNFSWNINKVNRLRANLGFRFTSLQPFGELSTYALSPRFNASFSITKWLDIRAGIGLNSKTPGLNYLYPDKKYDDRVAANYMPQTDQIAQLLAYHTQVYNVEASKHLKNATTTKVEVGLDFKLPNGKKLSLLAYRDRTPNGFGNLSDHITYTSNVYTPSKGLIITSGAATTIDYNNPERQDIVFMTTGKVGNTNTTINKGVEFDFDFGEIKAIHTSFSFNGAYSETKTYSTDIKSESVKSALLPASYSSYGLTPFKVIYPSGLDYESYRRFINTLRIVTHIPRLKMVATFTAQAIWHDWHKSYTGNNIPIGWIDTDLQRHHITANMLGGYLGMDAKYYETAPIGTNYVAIQDLASTTTDKEPTKNPVTWNLSGRLTKELGRLGGLSLYVNNMLYYEPFLTGNKTSTLTQRNTNNFNFGVELYFNL